MSTTEPNADDDEPEVDPALLERGKQAVGELEDAARKLGLYVQHAQLGVHAEGSMAVIATFLIGDIAFSDRVQNPAQDDTEDQFRAIESSMKKEEFEELRERLRQERET